MAINDLWPLFDLQIITERLTMRVPNDHDLAALIDTAKAGIHDPATMPFAVPWTDLPSPDFERSALQYHWGTRATFAPAKWDLGFVIKFEGQVIGMQGLHATSFPILRSIETGSWLGLAHQGKGIGKEMRAAAVRFAFEYLGAEQITSGAFEDNEASQRVTLATGYEPNGRDRMVRRGMPAGHLRFMLTRARWEATRSDTGVFEVSGFEPCRSMFGL